VNWRGLFTGINLECIAVIVVLVTRLPIPGNLVRETKEEIEAVYPSQYETAVLLKDGSSMFLRPIRGNDAARWLAFIGRLSPHAKYLRFHHMPKEMGLDDAVRFCTVDYDNTFALVAEVLRETNSEIVALGRYYRLPKKHIAEVDFAVEDAYQDKGIGTSLIEQLANAARENGITSFEADVLAENPVIFS